MRPSPVDRERGFGLIELIVCVGLLVTGSVAALALLPPLLRASQAAVLREAATDVARNALERARAAAAYYPAGAVSDPGTRASTTATHAWAFVPSAWYVAAARLQHPVCGTTAASTDVPLNVTLTYDATSDAFGVAVDYPHDPCIAGSPRETVRLSATLAPASYAPQTQLIVPIADPATQ